MKAMIVEESRELALIDLPEPVPGPGQALVDVKAIGVGYVDVMAVQGSRVRFPGTGAAPGLEVVGRVRAVGRNVPET